MVMEILDVVDRNGIPTGKTVTREEAHRDGVLHRTSHVWIFRRRGERIEVLFQKRAAEKDSFPNCYDVASGGHIPAGDDFLPSAIRELKEELGVTADAGELEYCCRTPVSYRDGFHGKAFLDREINNVYLLWLDQEAEAFAIDPTEVQKVHWFDLNDVTYRIAHGDPKFCVYLEELMMVRKYLGAENE